MGTETSGRAVHQGSSSTVYSQKRQRKLSEAAKPIPLSNTGRRHKMERQRSVVK